MSGVAQADVRVILLGRTGLDAALRLDPGIELIRARTPFEAIGEVACPIDNLSPTRTVVVVAPKVEGLLDPASPDEGKASDFVGALRVAFPDVVVLGVQNGSPIPAAFHAGLRPDADSQSLRDAVRWRPGLGQPPQAIVLHAGAARPVPQTHATRPTGGDAGDVALVAELIKGQDILPLALAMLRERAGDPGLQFHPLTDQPPAGEGVAVVWESAKFGDLQSRVLGRESLGRHARWLAGWLRLRDQHGQLRAAAFTDPLTGAWNRRYFDRFIVNAVEQSRVSRTYLTVLLFDIDDFKKYNDLYGHDAGDQILRETVKLLRSVIRPTDRVCRVGGDEFAVIFHEPQGPRQPGSHHPTDVLTIAARFQQQVLTHKFPKLLNCAPGTLTISGGLATFPWDGATPAELLAKADQLAMQSKRQGKNAITIGPGAMRQMEQ
jgi:two-component system, cell cycle response regulator